MKILNKLTIKHLAMNKKRTVVTIIGVILSTALMVGIGLLFSSLRDNTIKTTIHSNGAQHAKIEDIPFEKKSIIENNVYVKNVFYEHHLGVAKIGEKEESYLLVSEVSKGLLDAFTLKKGRLPENENEIIIRKECFDNVKIGDTLTLKLGQRKSKDGALLDLDSQLEEGETLADEIEKSYKVVGIVERNFTQKYSLPGYMAYTKLDINKKQNIKAYITYKSPKDAYDKTDKIASNLGFSKMEKEKNVSYNDALLSSYGVSRYSNIMDSMMGVIIIVLTLISIGCITVIYNAFAISVMERKKQFGLFASIGTTRKQTRHTVFFEAFIIGIIGIPLGVIGALLGISIVLMITNSLITEAFEFPLVLSIYPTFIIVPVIFMILVILLSAFLPAHKASKITPIEAIRQNDDIKIKGRKVKTNIFIQKIFGVEGNLALKNIKRNKKKYRITILSLFISIVLFISFSSLMEYGVSAVNDMATIPEFDIFAMIHPKHNEDTNKFYEKLKNKKEVKKSTLLSSSYFTTDAFRNSYTKEALQYIRKEKKEKNFEDIILTSMDDENYKKLLKKYHLKENTPIVLNKVKKIVYKKGSRKVMNITLFDENIKEIPVYINNYDEEKDRSTMEKVNTLSNIYYIDELPYGCNYQASNENIQIIVSEKMLKEMNQKSEHVLFSNVYITADDIKSLENYLSKIEEDNNFDSFFYQNIKEAIQMQKNLIIVIELLLYGFIALVTLIGVTSVFNTIHTSVALRRKEFAMLRSIGLTPRGFNKILYFESFFVGIKALIYALPVTLVISFLISRQVSNVVDSAFMIPYKSIMIATIGVFLIVLITMLYAASKVKKENILEAIREENI